MAEACTGIMGLWAVATKLCSLLNDVLTNNHIRSTPELIALSLGLSSLCTALGRLQHYISEPQSLLPHTIITDLAPTLSACGTLLKHLEAVLLKAYATQTGKIGRTLRNRIRCMLWSRDIKKLRLALSEHKLTIDMRLNVATCVAAHQVQTRQEQMLTRLDGLLGKKVTHPCETETTALTAMPLETPRMETRSLVELDTNDGKFLISHNSSPSDD
ncbi:hypothetical protein BDZ91DRAFT_745003 [Kalaharituber pfeilii]|nr:hypothetical protein BDZ91DRAFT_745003 [Kalaharituber pfeilii]